jgi:hypothetical protein
MAGAAGGTVAYSDAELESMFPWIKWREPQFVRVLGREDGDGVACRFCTAQKGLRGDAELMTIEQWESHMTTEHPRG